MLTRDHSVLPATHMFIHEWNEPYLPLLTSCSVTLLWSVLIFRTAEDRRLSCPEWLGYDALPLSQAANFNKMTRLYVSICLPGR